MSRVGLVLWACALYLCIASLHIVNALDLECEPWSVEVAPDWETYFPGSTGFYVRLTSEVVHGRIYFTNSGTPFHMKMRQNGSYYYWSMLEKGVASRARFVHNSSFTDADTIDPDDDTWQKWASPYNSLSTPNVYHATNPPPPTNCACLTSNTIYAITNALGIVTQQLGTVTQLLGVVTQCFVVLTQQVHVHMSNAVYYYDGMVGNLASMESYLRYMEGTTSVGVAEWVAGIAYGLQGPGGTDPGPMLHASMMALSTVSNTLSTGVVSVVDTNLLAALSNLTVSVEGGSVTSVWVGSGSITGAVQTGAVEFLDVAATSNWMVDASNENVAPVLSNVSVIAALKDGLLTNWFGTISTTNITGLLGQFFLFAAPSIGQEPVFSQLVCNIPDVGEFILVYDLSDLPEGSGYITDIILLVRSFFILLLPVVCWFMLHDVVLDMVKSFG